MVGAEREDAVDLRARAGREVDGGPGLLRHLDRGRADPARPRVDENRLALRPSPPSSKTVSLAVQIDFDDRRPLGEAPRLSGIENREPRVEERVLRVAALRDEAEHPVADLERRDPRPRGGDLPGELEPRDVAEAGRHRIGAGALEAVRPVDPRGAHPDQQLARPGPGLGGVDHRQYLGPAVRGDDHLLHFTIPPSATAPSPRLPRARARATGHARRFALSPRRGGWKYRFARGGGERVDEAVDFERRRAR